MKHISSYKLFESNLPYEEISGDEYNLLTLGSVDSNIDSDEFIRDHWVDFNDKELEIISKLLPEIEPVAVYPTTRSRVDSKEKYVFLKLKDEWYYILDIRSEIYELKFFKCDQFDGLIKCIKDIII